MKGMMIVSERMEAATRESVAVELEPPGKIQFRYHRRRRGCSPDSAFSTHVPAKRSVVFMDEMAA